MPGRAQCQTSTISPLFGRPASCSTRQAVGRSGTPLYGMNSSATVRSSPARSHSAPNASTIAVERQLLQQPGVEVADAERAGHLEDGLLLVLLRGVPVGGGAPAGQVLHLQHGSPGRRGDLGHRSGVESGSSASQ